MTATTLARTPPAIGASAEFPHVLDGVVLDGTAARLAGMLDRGLLEEAGWDPTTRILFLPAHHRLLGRRVCRAGQCAGTVHNDCPGVCYRCFTRLQQLGMSAADIAAAQHLPAAPSPAGDCAVPGCQCKPTVRQAVLCEPHAGQFRNRWTPIPLEQFLTDRRVRPLPPLPACLVLACTRMADGAVGYCNTHYQRWRVAQRGNAGVDEQWWQATEPGVAEPGQVNLRALPELVVTEVLAGLQTRLRGGLRLTDVVLRAVGDTLRRQQAVSICDCDPGLAAGKRARSVLRAFTRDVRRALADPGTEQSKDIWDLAIFGHPGALSFTKITQPWLAAAAKRWVAGQLPRHRGSGASRVQAKISNVGLLSQHLNGRPDHGSDPAALGRGDVENFLNRIAYLEATGEISRYRRNMICRDVRTVLAGIRALGLARAGRAAAGLAGDVAVERADIPADPQRGEPGRDLPPEIMTVLCANLHTLEPAEVRVATQIGIDTGRRPEDILNLPLDCLARDKDGGAVLVYDNVKADRLGRRLPISNATAEVITSQQDRVRQRFPHTPAATLKLLPATYRNPDGNKPISRSTLEARHRDWVSTLPALRSRDGAVFDPVKIVPYAYRHSYAQRHADAGVPIDVLAELLDHRSYSVTRGYYRIGEDRRRDAVDKVTTLSFDRHGNRIWRDARALLESERARHAVGEVAVPYGTCSEPANVQAGGGACPVRFRCAGCDHFQTNVAFLPDLQAYLQDLLRTRERLAAAIDGVEEWARADATPAEEEIVRIRHLITRIKGDIADLDDAERAQIDEAVAVIRRHRAPPRLPRHACPPGRCTHTARYDHHRLGGNRMNTTTKSRPMLEGRHADSTRRRQRVIAALDRAAAEGAEISASGIARAAAVDRTFLYRHRDLLEKIHALQAEPAVSDRAGPAITRASLQADLLAAHERAVRLNTRVQHLEKRLSQALGDHAWRESGLGAPADIDALNQKITRLEQQAADLRLQLEERDDDLAAARAANRELMAQLNHAARSR